ncbi:MAG TPA: hypothetical protein VFW44_17215 [Bryobacteraceae bacterium]|nr:hypothetical protein [Bryobacteraceae bacterium]
MTRLGLCFCWTLLLPGQILQNSDQAPAQMAARISSLVPRHATASLEFQNLTTFPAAEWSNFQSRLRDELRQAGLETVPAATTPLENRVRVSLSEGSRGFLLVGEVSTGENRQVAMLAWNPPASIQAKPPVTISQKPLLTRSDPILDVLVLDSEMLVLSPSQVTSFRMSEGKWTLAETASLTLARPMPRDPRGRIEPSGSGFRAYLPAGTCDGTIQPEVKVTCSKETAVWQAAPVHWVADRNVLEPASDDRAHIADPCGAGMIAIAASTYNEHDSVRVWDGAAPMSDPLPLPGPVTALWPAESGREATLVVHNLQTGEYEASRLGLACTR